MGKSMSVHEFAAKMGKAAGAVSKANKDWLNNGALSAKKEMEKAARVMSGGDMVLSHVGKRGGRLGVGYQIHGDQALIFARGPWGIVETGARPHLITSRHGGSRSARAGRLGGASSGRKTAGLGSLLGEGPVFGRGRVRGAVNIPGVGWRAYARHPGTHGKHGWAKQAPNAVQAANKGYDKAIGDALASVF